MSDTRRWRWFQVSLRSLFGLTLLVAAYFAGYVTATKQGTRVERVRGMAWCNDLEAAKREAAATERLVLLHFSAVFAPPCRFLERTVFSKPQFARAVEEHFVPVKLDVEESKDLAQQYNVHAVPCDVVITPQGKIVGRRIGAPPEEDYVAQLTKIAFAARAGVADVSDDLKVDNRPTADGAASGKSQ
jgi:thioredoxin-related protein